MAKIRLEDVYDEDDLLDENRVTTHKHKNPLKDSDSVFAKSKSKSKTCKMKKNRRAKNDF